MNVYLAVMGLFAAIGAGVAGYRIRAVLLSRNEVAVEECLKGLVVWLTAALFWPLALAIAAGAAIHSWEYPETADEDDEDDGSEEDEEADIGESEYETGYEQGLADSKLELQEEFERGYQMGLDQGSPPGEEYKKGYTEGKRVSKRAAADIEGYVERELNKVADALATAGHVQAAQELRHWALLSSDARSIIPPNFLNK